MEITKHYLTTLTDATEISWRHKIGNMWRREQLDVSDIKR